MLNRSSRNGQKKQPEIISNSKAEENRISQIVWNLLRSLQLKRNRYFWGHRPMPSVIRSYAVRNFKLTAPEFIDRDENIRFFVWDRSKEWANIHIFHERAIIQRSTFKLDFHEWSVCRECIQPNRVNSTYFNFSLWKYKHACCKILIECHALGQFGTDIEGKHNLKKQLTNNVSHESYFCRKIRHSWHSGIFSASKIIRNLIPSLS